ncbi:MAG: phospho-N-acetylmuramoyl-pentapeptide-transferase [Phycisphaerales bacterium]
MLYLLLDLTRDWLVDHGLYFAFRLLDEVQFRALAAAGLSFLLVVALGRRAIRLLVSMKIGDSGSTDAEALRAHAASKANVPTMGGALVCGAILVSMLLLADLSTSYVQLGLITLVWLAALGGADDWLKLTAARRGAGRQGLLAWEKLVFQLGLGLIIGIFAYRAGGEAHSVAHAINLPFQKTYASVSGVVSESLIYLPRWAYVLIAVVLITGMSNAVNITDGMDGLATGTAVSVSLGLMALTLIAGSASVATYLYVPHIPYASELAVLAGAMAGACLGFLWWNCSPAQVFMGDTGSLPIGGLIAYIAIVVRQELVVLLMCGVFLAEIASVVLQVGYFRATGGKRIFRCAPWHHHLHLGGWTEQQVVARLWIVAIILGVLALATLKIR